MKCAQYYVHILLKNLQVLPNCIIQSTKISDIFQRLDTEVDAEKEQVYISGKF